MEEVLVPLGLFTLIGVIFGLSKLFNFRTRQELQLTLREAMSSGQPMSADLVEQLGRQLENRNTDLRRGVIAIAIGIATFVFGQVLGEEEAAGPLGAIAAFPMIIGIAYIGLWLYTRKPAQPSE